MTRRAILSFAGIEPALEGEVTKQGTVGHGSGWFGWQTEFRECVNRSGATLRTKSGGSEDASERVLLPEQVEGANPPWVTVEGLW